MKPVSRILLSSLLAALCFSLVAAQSGRQYRRSAVMNGNQVRTVFGNWGVIGQPIDTRPRGAWKNDNNGYLGDVSPFIGAEVKWQDTSFHSVATCPVARPTDLPDQSPGGFPWTLEPVGGYFADPPNQSVALSNDNATWPTQWPDKLNDHLDPGWKGSWNGYFGKRVSADLETYFVMDDNDDQRFNFAQNNPRGIAFKPDSSNPSRNGLGLSVNVRALQWSQFLAQDNIFWLYEITNAGTTSYDRVVFGMLVGTYVGVTGSADNGEYDDDWSFYDALTNTTYTGDFDNNTTRNPRWVGPVGMVGYAFLETPGNPFDGIDNDGDADSSASGASTPKFTAASFVDTMVTAGMTLVSIRNDFSRVLFTVPHADSFKAWTHGMRDSIWLYPGRTRLVEGNVVVDLFGNQSINPNAYDGIDNNFNGLIDENQFVHYRQFKVNRNPPHQTLFDVLRPLHYWNFRANTNVDSYSMIDERRDDLIDNNRDWNVQFDDVGLDGIGPNKLGYPGPDFGEGDGLPTSGYARPELNEPGEPHIDKTDVRESDQIGLTSFYYFTPASQVRLGDKESLWKNLAPGFFDVPQSIEYNPGIGNSFPTRGEDGDFIYGSGYFPLLAKATERFSLALVYGGDLVKNYANQIADLLKNKRTVQKIYDANYLFPVPPDAPTVVAVPGDHQVTLYWDRVAEASVDPVLLVKDFEGYKVFKSTDPDFRDIHTITDANGTEVDYRPIAQFDLQDSIKGYFQAQGELAERSSGYSFYLGDNTGLQHSFVDRDVDNGRKYYYAVVAYDRGDATVGIPPSENKMAIRFTSTGSISNKDINVVAVTPNAPTAGYVRAANGVSLSHISGAGTGSAVYQVLDETKITGHRYRVEFLDTQVDSVDNNGNGLLDGSDSTEWNRQTSFYSVHDLQPISEVFISQDTINVKLQHKNLIRSTVSVKNGQGVEVPPSTYSLDITRGAIRSSSPGSLPEGKYTISFEYYPVYHSPNIQGTPFLKENREADIFDGIQIAFQNFWYSKDSLTSWVGKAAYIYNLLPVDLPLYTPPLRGFAKPSDYEIQFSSSVVDTSTVGPFPYDVPVPTYFRVFDLTDSAYVKFYFQRSPYTGGLGKIAPLADLLLLEKNPRDEYSLTWEIYFLNKPTDPSDTVYNLTTGDKLVLRRTKPFRQGDIFEFSTVPPRVDSKQASGEMENIRVVPNPYVTQSSFEPPLNPGITSGRGERKIEFIHLPPQSTVRIFTSRGDHVATLHHDGDMHNGTAAWNLKTDENLDVAFGIYFYVVESPVGSKTGKIAIIK